MNVVTLLREAAQRAPARCAIAAPGRNATSLTFGELWDRADRVSTGLVRAGLHAGDRVICMVPLSAELYVCLMALLKAGATIVFVDPWIGLRQVAAFAAFAGPRGFIGVPRSHLLRLAEPALRRLPLTVSVGGKWGRLTARHTLAELARLPGDGVVATAAADTPALITFTSGSSGTPKGASRPHGVLIAQHEALTAAFPYQDDDCDMPMFPIFALNNLARGITTVLPDFDVRRVAQADGSRLLAQMRSHGVTTCTASPPFFDRLTEALAQPGAGRPRLRRILTGGAPVSDAQLGRWRAALPDTEIVVVYGSTEAEPVAHLHAAERLAAGAAAGPAAGCCAGRCVPAVQARVIPIHHGPVVLPEGRWDDWSCPAGTVGELVVTGAHVCRAYDRNPQATAENKITDATGAVWHRMGDTGYFDAQDRFWLVGRVHATWRRAGVWVHPFPLEQAALRAGAVQAAAVGVPDAALGERVVLLFRGPTTAERVKAALAADGLDVDEVRPSARPLPVDPRHNAKVDYVALRRTLGAARR